jgi:hypothetical protein
MSSNQQDNNEADVQKRVRIISNMDNFEAVIHGHNFEVSIEEGNELVVAPQDPVLDSECSITGQGHMVIVRNGRTIIRPQSALASEAAKFRTITACAYPTERLLELRQDAGLSGETRNVLNRMGILKHAAPRPSIFGVQWRLACPFANPDLARRDSYMVPQLMAVNIRPVPEGDSWRLPKTLVVASTQTALDHIRVKVENVLSNLSRDPLYPGLIVPPNTPPDYKPWSSLEYIEQCLEDFATGVAPIMVCTPDLAAKVVERDVEHIWWLNVKVQMKEHSDALVEMLDALKECEGALQRVLRLTVCFGQDDKLEARFFKAWLKDYKPDLAGVDGLAEFERHFR